MISLFVGILEKIGVVIVDISLVILLLEDLQLHCVNLELDRGFHVY